MKWPNATADASNAISPKRALLPGKTLDTFEFEAVPMISKAHAMAVAAGDGWIEQGAKLLLFGPPGVGKAISPPPSASP